MSYVKLIMITWGNLYNKKYLGESNISQIRLKRVSLLRVIALVLCISTTLGLATSCDNNSNAQSNEIDLKLVLIPLIQTVMEDPLIRDSF